MWALLELKFHQFASLGFEDRVLQCLRELLEVCFINLQDWVFWFFYPGSMKGCNPRFQYQSLNRSQGFPGFLMLLCSVFCAALFSPLVHASPTLFSVCDCSSFLILMLCLDFWVEFGSFGSSPLFFCLLLSFEFLLLDSKMPRVCCCQVRPKIDAKKGKISKV